MYIWPCFAGGTYSNPTERQALDVWAGAEQRRAQLIGSQRLKLGLL